MTTQGVRGDVIGPGDPGCYVRELDDTAIETVARYHQEATSPASEIHFHHFLNQNLPPAGPEGRRDAR